MNTKKKNYTNLIKCIGLYIITYYVWNKKPKNNFLRNINKLTIDGMHTSILYIQNFHIIH